MENGRFPFWSLQREEVLKKLGTSPEGLSEGESKQRLQQYGPNTLGAVRKKGSLSLFFNQIKSPIVLILLFATSLSFIVHDPTDALIILVIVLLSAVLGFLQEHGAENAVEKLLETIKIQTNVLRDGETRTIPVEGVVPGDIVSLSAGARIPGDCLVLDSNYLHVNESILTGESYPVEKSPLVLKADTPLGQRINCLWMGTNVVSGSATAVVITTAKNTEFGKISERLKLKPPETEFQRGVRRFGFLLLEVTIMLVLAIFAVNVYLKRPVMQSFLFSLALAVGLTPQLLPVIISINLAHGAKRMARDRVIVKRLSSIENYGSMNVLCSDKTGTLTEGTVRVYEATAWDGSSSERVFIHAYLNSLFETGFSNPVDEAVRSHGAPDVVGYRKLDEVPYDFIRKRLSVLVEKGSERLMVTKGALHSVLAICSHAEDKAGRILPLDQAREEILKRYENLSGEGYRVLGVASRSEALQKRITRDDERNMIFSGFLVLYDPPKENIDKTIDHIRNLGVSLKIITGDSSLVASHMAAQVGISGARALTGNELRDMSDEALILRVGETEIFAEVEPTQKERIILALKKAGNVVGYMGDGINDASALHAADVGISVDSAVDVAKEAADIVLLDKDLGVLVHGIEEGRKTFSNTMKYVFMATSANFGNMFSMAGASLFLPFLPLLPKQILLTNLLTDVPEMTIAADNVDPDKVQKPQRWDIGFIRRFMLTFGILSSAFDYATFAVLFFLLKASTEQFRSGWFIESVMSATCIVLVIRTRKFFLKSRPQRYLVLATLLIAATAVVIPYSPLAKLFSFHPLPPVYLLIVILIIVSYVFAAELTKRIFYGKHR